MADVRALLKAKRQEARITHPYANYSSNGQLRCVACGTLVKQASMWEGHIGSKAHRTAVIRMKAHGEEAATKAKRKQSEEMDDEEMQTEEERNTKRTKVEAEHNAAPNLPKGFPVGFFSDPSRAPVLEDNDDDEENAAKSQLDLEWEQFQAAVVNAPAVDEEKEEEKQSAFVRATVFAEPELATNGNEGLPESASSEGVTGATNAGAPIKEESEEEKRKRLEQDDRELIMDRLIEEERVQEEADARVGLLKAKVEALKKARELKKNRGKANS